MRHKRVYWIWWLILLFNVLAAGCTPEPVTFAPPWQEGEVSVLEITRDNEVVAINELQVEVAGSELVFTGEYYLTRQPQLRRVYCNPVTLQPRLTRCEEIEQDGEVLLEVIYGEEEAVVSRKMSEEKEFTVTLPEGQYFDYEQYLFLVRALPLQEGWRGTLHLLVGFAESAPTVSTAKLKVLRQESITVPAGTFDAFVVEIENAGQYTWVGVEAPHPVLRHENRTDGTVSELVEFHEQGRS